MFEDILNGKNNLAVFHPEHAGYSVEVRNSAPTLKDLQNLVAGFIEVATDQRYGLQLSAPGPDLPRPRKLSIPVQVIVNEEGKVYRMPYNSLGTAFIKHIHPGWDDPLVGPVVVLAGWGVRMR